MSPTVKQGSERRLYPRFETKLPVKLAANGYDFSTTTENISCAGAYCHIDKYIPPFTKLAIKMCVNKTNIECGGVVVRTDDEKNGGFNIAIFFNRINDIQKQKIANYLKA